MTKDEIAKVLKESRINTGLEAKEVAEKLIEMGAIKSIKSFYNWESGRTQPDADIFMYLCNLYNVKNVMELFGYNAGYKKKTTPSESNEVAEAYGKAELKIKVMVRSLLELPVLEESEEEKRGKKIS